jgi:hypothetical protein
MGYTGMLIVIVERDAMWWLSLGRERQAWREIVDIMNERLPRKCDVIVDFGVGSGAWWSGELSGRVGKILGMTLANEFVTREFRG